MEIGEKAPEFKSLDHNGKKIALKDFKGKWVVLYFYPRADTPGCTIEACGFRDSYERIERTGAVLLGVSPDDYKAQKKFEEKYDLPFTLVADPDKTICNLYGVIQEKNMYGKKVMGVARTTFVIGPDGEDQKHFQQSEAGRARGGSARISEERGVAARKEPSKNSAAQFPARFSRREKPSRSRSLVGQRRASVGMTTRLARG